MSQNFPLMKSKEELLATLDQFTGSQQAFYHPMFKKFVYTEGVRYLAQNAECYWLLEHIFLHQTNPKIKAEGFQTWKLVKQEDTATITIDDGNGNIIETFPIDFTDFPLDEIILFMIGDTLLLPSEY